MVNQLSPLDHLAETLSGDALQHVDAFRQAQTRLQEIEGMPRSREVSRERRELRTQLRDLYWELCRSYLVNAIPLDDPPKYLEFGEAERLFFDIAVVGTEEKNLLDRATELLEETPPLDQFRYYRFSGLLREQYALLSQLPLDEPLPGMAGSYTLQDRIRHLEERLAATQQRQLMLQEIMLRLAASEEEKQRALTFHRTMGNSVTVAMERRLRTQRVRFATASETAMIHESAGDYETALKERNALLDAVQQRLSEDHLEQFLQFRQLDKTVEQLAEFIVILQEEARRTTGRRERLADRNRNRGIADIRKELTSFLQKNRQFLERAATRSHIDPAPFFFPAQPPATFSSISAELQRILQVDPELVRTLRIRAHGLPRVVICPGTGNGLYNWDDHTLLFPLVPPRDIRRSVAHALALLRWDADEDRELKDTFAQLQSNKGKSIAGLQEAFCRNYLEWVTREADGYRILGRKIRQWFQWKIPKAKEQ
ncbi:MAG: hypothetical protein K9L28_06625 [Synergistales bacterium]|nr:hypothetical protein [Synergistales bacterium]